MASLKRNKNIKLEPANVPCHGPEIMKQTRIDVGCGKSSRTVKAKSVYETNLPHRRRSTPVSVA